MGYFYGFKLHLVINDQVELLNLIITQGNVDDREPKKTNGLSINSKVNYIPIKTTFQRT